MKAVLKILLLEDCAEDAELVQRALRKENIAFISAVVDNREAFIKRLHEFRPDVVLSDHALPQFNSIEALQLFHEHQQNGPFILVTGTVSEEFAVNCLKQGADDYVLKSNLSRLPKTILNALNQREAESRKKLAEKALREQNDKLILANQQLEKINKELDNFVYSVSHNLKAPLSSILGLIHLARLETQNKDQHFRPFLSMMEQNINRLDLTLKEILDYSYNARGEIKLESLDLEQAFFRNLDKLKYMAGAEQLETSFCLDQQEPFCSDAFRINIIFSNLISNAIKYRDRNKNKNTLNISGTITRKEAVLNIEDNGIGICSTRLPSIFNMFYRATEKSEGAGLGLYIVKEAIERLNGKIAVQSQEGRGTAFTLVLPNPDSLV